MLKESEKKEMNTLGNGGALILIKQRLLKSDTGRNNQRIDLIERPEMPEHNAMAEDFAGQALFWLGMARNTNDQVLKKHYYLQAQRRLWEAEKELSERVRKACGITN